MNFFKSVFAEDPNDYSAEDRETHQDEELSPDPDPPQKPRPTSNPKSSPWSFGGLIKTLSEKSEGVLETYRRDLEEFSSGLKQETAAIREAATRAVKDLPGSLEAGASVAQESLESVGQALDDLIAQGKEVLISSESSNQDFSFSHGHSSGYSNPGLGQTPVRYSRLDAQIRILQGDLNTYCEEPEDLVDFDKWRLGFVLEDKKNEIEVVCGESNGVMEGILGKLVPRVVDYETFWTRYFYRVHKLKQAEGARADLVKRVISREEEEELSWEVDDDEFPAIDPKDGVSGSMEPATRATDKVAGYSKSHLEGELIDESETQNVVASTSGNRNMGDADYSKKSNFEETLKLSMSNLGNNEMGSGDYNKKMNADSSVSREFEKKSDTNEASKEVEKEAMVEESGVKPSSDKGTVEDKMIVDGKADTGESSKDSDFSVVSSQPSIQEEDDLGWDEIEDLGEHDDKKESRSGSPIRIDIRKRLSAADEDDDLSWDVEDDDSVKS
ncbi:hypothetical protein AMTRI_Chr01g114440 [Amborella trichopoda]